MKNLFIILFVLLFVINLCAQDDAEKQLKALQSKFNSINDLSADVNQQSAGKSNLSGNIIFKKENKIRLELGNLLLISDGKTSWNYNKKENKVIISNYDSEESSIYSINYLIYEYPGECNLSLKKENEMNVLSLIPKTKKTGLGKVELWIDKDNLVKRINVTESNSGNYQISFSNYKLNKNVPDSRFSFTPPNGSTVIDLTY